jgi:CSLREA domain-containing protein
MDPKGVVRLVAGLAIAGVLAGRATAATITVNSAGDGVADDGWCTLREAINAANFNFLHLEKEGYVGPADGREFKA